MLKVRYEFLEQTLGRHYNVEKFVDATMESDEPDTELDQLEAMIAWMGEKLIRASLAIQRN